MKRLLAIILFCFSPAFAQYSLEIRFVSDPERSSYIATFRRNNILYGSLNDIASAFQFKTTVNTAAQRIEVTTNRYVIKTTANNPFIVIVDRGNNAHVEQMPVSPLFAANKFFVPLEPYISLLDVLLEEEVVFNKELGMIAVGEPYPKSKFDIEALSIEERANGSLVRIHSNKQITDYESWLKPIEAKNSEEYWLYVTLVGATVDTTALQTMKPRGLVKQLLVFQSPTSAQLTFRLRGKITGSELLQAENSTDLLLTIHTPTTEELARKHRKEIEKNLERERGKWKLDVIVIDAGHGGKDVGAIGVKRTQEKDIALSVALKVGRLIQKQLRGVRVVYTRTTDDFVELYRRGQIANEAGGKLFVSIHCNSMPRKPHPTNGFEIYLLRPGKTEHALQIAERENSVVQFEEGYEKRYQELTEENFILLTMAQSAYMKYSEQFAEILQSQMEVHSGLENQGVKQAGFYVLVGASMPNVLVETGYLSNRSDERVLKSQSGQQKIAQAIFNGVKRYKQEYEKTLEEGRMVGTRE